MILVHDPICHVIKSDICMNEENSDDYVVEDDIINFETKEQIQADEFVKDGRQVLNCNDEHFLQWL